MAEWGDETELRGPPPPNLILVWGRGGRDRAGGCHSPAAGPLLWKGLVEGRGAAGAANGLL